MIQIKNLSEEDMKKAVELRIMCWTEELVGMAENDLIYSDELKLWTDWKNSSEENNDIRLLIGAFENNELLGVCFSSFAETYDIPDKGIELNGLWVNPEHRNRGISLMLLDYIMNFYINVGIEKLVVYNHHYSKSNSYYYKLGAKVVKQTNQMNGRLLVDVFMADITTVKRNIEQSLKKYL